VVENKKILFVVHRRKPLASGIAAKLSRLAAANGMDTEICDCFPVPDSSFDGKDVCCVIGGDGTILSSAPSIARHKLRVFGINLGKLGFLATYTDDIDNKLFLTLAKGGGRIFERAMLEAEYEGQKHVALNDFVVKDLRVDGVSRFVVYADGEFIAEYTGDGLVFSTPTGSTAYNLSAGGPLIHPKSRSFVMTPICPHTLSNRSLVYDSSSKIRVVCVSGESALIADGMRVSTLSHGSAVNLMMSDETIKFVRRAGHSHFGILRSKLGWAEDPRQISNEQ